MDEVEKLLDDSGEVTPEKVRKVQEKVSDLLANQARQQTLLRELVANLVSKVGTEVEIYQPRRVNVRLRCEACFQVIAVEYTEKVWEFDGKYWHKYACMRSKTTT